MIFQKDERVNTPQGEGVVVYQRMKAPNYSDAEAVSVCLDSKKDWIGLGYAGTTFLAEEVIKVK